MGLADFLKRLFFPEKCVYCGKMPEKEGSAFCKSCRTEYDKAKFSLCPSCHRPHCRCCCTPPCAHPDVFLYLSVIPYKEHSPGGRAILTVKNRKDRRALALLGRDMAVSLQNGCILKEDALVTYAPRNKKAVLETGTDQAKELAAIVAEQCNLPQRSLLVHAGGKGQQKERSMDMRIVSAQQSYQIIPSCPPLNGRQVIIVDDILTSGATITTCARILKNAGAGQIICLTAGRTLAKRRMT